MDNLALWQRYRRHLYYSPELHLMLDISRMSFPEDFLTSMESPMGKAFAEMNDLEKGAIANPDENRMVGHYWLRAPSLAPADIITAEIELAQRDVMEFVEKIHDGRITAEGGRRFRRLLVVGIGGSALGPQLVADALGSPEDRLIPYFLDNTDPDGIDRVLAEIGVHLGETLTLIISKSGGTKETRNGMLEAKRAFADAGISFERHAVAITGRYSDLDKIAIEEGWLARFPMFDWVGGRTSVTSTVGILPAALQGINTEALMAGAARCDALTRRPVVKENPAALLALMWYHATKGKGEKDMVVLPYKDRLILFGRYLQQLIMESLGKGADRDGNTVNQGITVYGNKGSTDQHAYVQQLREGVNNFFVTFIEVLRDREGRSMEVEAEITSGDYLAGFLQGTRRALFENGRESITITVEKLDPATVGALIALFERAVGFYASLVNINAYHQPGVEAGKKAAGAVLELQSKIFGFIRDNKERGFTADEVAAGLGCPEEAETVFKILLHASCNMDHGIAVERGEDICASRFRARS
ncbi:MAG TPA: glucose-6-phosphate isomerase [Geobacteraceae bacterium]|nr:glucose-6-phosphate isomerase [Geobacteraceae bacterium]